MKILSFKLTEHIMPKGSSGTGCSEPDYFNVVVAEGLNRKEKKVMIDIWYRPIDVIKKEFKTGLRDAGLTLKNIENLDEAFEMYVDEIANESCPWNKKEILDANNY